MRIPGDAKEPAITRRELAPRLAGTTQRDEPNIKRRTFVLLGALAPLLGACGGAARPRRQLRVFLGLDAYERGVFERVINPGFTAQSGIEVLMTRGTGAETRELIATGNQSDVPDLAALDLEVLGDLAATASIKTLDDLGVQIPSTAPAAMVSALRWEQSLIALPWRPSVWVAFYNRARFEGAGVAPPDTWSALATMATSFPAGSGGGGFALQGAAGSPAAQSMTELVWAFGGNPLRLDDDGSLEAARYVEFLAPRLAPVSADGKIDTIATAIGTGQIGWGPNWTVTARELLQKTGNPELAVHPGPGGPSGRAHLISGQVFVLPRQSREREGAVAFVHYLWSPGVQAELASRLAWVPLIAPAFAALPAWLQPASAAIQAALGSARHLPPLPDRGDVDGALSALFRGVAFERQPVSAALAEASRRLRDLRLP